MISISLIGFGNIGKQLFKAFNKKEGVTVKQVYSPSLKPQKKGKTSFINVIENLQKSTIFIIAISDDEIGSFSEKIPFENELVVHTAGSVSMKALASKNRRGVFYPLQTFSEGSKIKWKEIPVCVEAENEKDLELLMRLGYLLTKKVISLSSEKRLQLHLGAVWVNNFSNHLFHLAEDFLNDAQLDFDLLKPLIKETVNKIKKSSPSKVQTGPAKRNDQKTMEAHLELLNNPKHKEIYKLLSESIQQKF